MKHGKTNTRAYRIWQNMKNRCRNKNIGCFKNYGGRGIVVCRRWNDSFENFLTDMGEPPLGHSIDRIDNNGSYSPTNCRWADSFTQTNNARSNLVLECFGKKQTLSSWAREIGINYDTLRYRILYYKWPIERALTETVRGYIPDPNE